MKKMPQHTVYTIGHSTHTIEVFIAMLKAYEIQLLVDVRRLPGSRKFPQFDQNNLEKALLLADIKYLHMPDLGGRRKAKKDSKNTVWRNTSFRGYADYMETPEFESAMHTLQKLAEAQTTAYMCAEAVWWRCHRSMISDYLKAKNWLVLHIMDVGKVQEHPFTAPARVDHECVFYAESIN